MTEQNATAILPATKRSMSSDDVVDILQFAVDAYRDGAVALATLVEIRGGAARALGSHVVVAADGRFCGYVSGGCVEASVASEALLAMAEGRDRTVRFGEGSPFFDLVLPCGGGITIAIHLVRNPLALHRVLERLSRRLPTALRYMPDRQMIETADPVESAGWVGEDFISAYRPVTRVVISGTSNEAAKLGVLARACGYDVVSAEPCMPDESTPLHGSGNASSRPRCRARRNQRRPCVRSVLHWSTGEFAHTSPSCRATAEPRVEPRGH